MAKLLPSALNEATTLAAADILLAQKDGETEVKRISGANLLAAYYDKTEVDGIITAAASDYGIKYSWADETARLAEVGMLELQQGVQLDTRMVYQYVGSAWVEFYALDVTGTLNSTDIGVTIQGYSADTVVDATYVATEESFTTAEQTKLGLIEDNATADQTKIDIDALAIDAATVTGFTVGVNVPALADFNDTTYTNVSEFTNDSGYLTAVAEGDVTAHQTALSITESQISDFGTYETADGTILKDADIGVNVQAYDANIVSDATYVATANDYTTVEQTKVAKIETVLALTDGATVAVNMAAYSNFTLTPTQSFTLNNPTTPVAGQRGFIAITQDATGSRVLTLDTNYKTAGGAGITLTTTASAVDVLRYEVISSTLILLELVADVK